MWAKMEVSNQNAIERTMVPQATQLIRSRAYAENMKGNLSSDGVLTNEKVQNNPNTLDLQEAHIDKEQLDVTIETLNTLSALSQQIEFRIDDQINEIYIQVTEKETGEVIKQIPPAELRQLRARMGEVVGMLLNIMA